MILKVKGINYGDRMQSYKNCERKQRIYIDVPENFCVLDNPKGIFDFIHYILDKHENRKWKFLNLNMKHITSIDSAGCCLLLSVFKELANIGITAVGNFPEDESCARILFESGLLNHMKNASGKKMYVSSKNTIIETGTDKTKNSQIGSVVRKAMAMITQKEQRFQPAYTVAMEICSNSVEHAYIKRPKHWLIGVNDMGGSVSFTMVDTGVGILKTIKKKFIKEVQDILLGYNSKEVLYRAFLRKYGSSTQSPNRNKGLPCILDKFQNGYIENLIVISNDVYLNFENRTKNIPLNKEFSGVLFYWEINKRCIDKFYNDNSYEND